MWMKHKDYKKLIEEMYICKTHLENLEKLCDSMATEILRIDKEMKEERAAAAAAVPATWLPRYEIFDDNAVPETAIGCSNCGKSQRRNQKTPYCPSCGHPMKL